MLDQGKNGLSVAHLPLAKCMVLYMGSAVPLEVDTGIEAVQQPLKDRYKMNSATGDIEGIDATIIVYSSGVQMQYVDDVGTVEFFPIQSLRVCAAVKSLPKRDLGTGEAVSRFVPLDSRDADKSNHPPIFTCIMRRTKGLKVLECHSFVCKNTEAALALVKATTHAYRHKEGWREDSPPAPVQNAKQAHLVPATNHRRREQELDASPEFYEKPPVQGYFYSSNKDIIKSYNVTGGRNLSSGQPPQQRYHQAPQKYYDEFTPQHHNSQPMTVFPGGQYQQSRSRRARRQRSQPRVQRSSSRRRRSPSIGHRYDKQMSRASRREYPMPLPVGDRSYRDNSYTDDESYSDTGSETEYSEESGYRRQMPPSRRMRTPPIDYERYGREQRSSRDNSDGYGRRYNDSRMNEDFDAFTIQDGPDVRSEFTRSSHHPAQSQQSRRSIAQSRRSAAQSQRRLQDQFSYY